MRGELGNATCQSGWVDTQQMTCEMGISEMNKETCKSTALHCIGITLAFKALKVIPILRKPLGDTSETFFFQLCLSWFAVEDGVL